MTDFWGPAESAADGALLVRRADGAILVSFNRPAKLNAFSPATYEYLFSFCEALRSDSSVQVVVFRGEGGAAFAAGNDISSFADMQDGWEGVAYERRVREALDGVRYLPQVTIAEVNGVCVGAGLALATCCDLRLSATTARFGYPIARTLGNALSTPVLQRCLQIFGESLTSEMLLASRLIDAQRAYAAGATMVMVPPDQLDMEATSIVRGILKAAPLTLRVSKEQIRAVNGAEVPEHESVLAEVYGSQDFREGVRAFLAGEKPRFGVAVE